jgi:photosynthetic reaction center cytochrome c subunit
MATCIVTMLSFIEWVPAPAQPHRCQENEDSLARDRAKYVALVMEKIKGQENRSSDSVFKNIKNLKMTAARLLKVMEFGYSRALGVSCGHCHNTSDFASEEKPQKEITRQMFDMSNKINFELLKNIQGLQTSPAIINCTTCHRGEIKPALNIQ